MVQYLLEPLAPALLVAAFFLILVSNWPRHRTWTRAITCATVFAVSVRYLWWRFFETVLPFEDGGIALAWVWFLFIIEVLAFGEITLFLLTMSRFADRGKEADALQADFAAKPEHEWPTVDVLIPTYDEPIDVLERSIVGALALDYPKDKLQVYVLDDQHRDWLRSYCETKGANYVTRADNRHAKAGNLNNGLRTASGEFVAIFDADFVPYRQFLRRTVPFFIDPTIGIVQTPQHFFNKDPVQSNLGIERFWPDEQRLFFDEMAASRDAWDVSFCCGSSSIMRRRAIDAIGGIPTESITEDLLTTLAMLNKGYKTRYLNERLSMGLAAENLRAYFIQRSRWCRGGIQSLFVPSGPLRGPGLSLFQRIMFVPLSWLVQYVVRFAILIVPIVYLWTGLAPLYFTSIADIVYYQLPVVLAYFFLMAWITPHRYLPLLSNAVGVFSTFRLLPTVIATLIRPFGEPFRVTPKGSRTEQSAFDSYTFTCIAVLITLTAAGAFINIVPEWAPVRTGEFSIVALYWAGVNVLVLMIAALICFEKPLAQLDSFVIDEPARVEAGDRVERGRLATLSLSAAVVSFGHPTAIAAGREMLIDVAGFPPLVARADRMMQSAEGLLVRGALRLDPATHDRLIVKLYTGGYSQEIRKLDRPAIVSGLWKRAFGRLATSE